MKAEWHKKKLGDVLQLEYGKPLDATNRTPSGLYPVYGANGEKDRSNSYFYDKPSIIIGRKGSAGEVNLTEERFWPLDVTYYVTFDEENYDLQFLYYLLLQLELPNLAKGVKPGINRNEVYSLSVNIPPLPEQKRIVAILYEAFEAIDAVRSNTEQSLQNARSLFESYIQSVFNKRDDGWSERKIGEQTLLSMIDGDRGSNYPKTTDFLNHGPCLFLNTKNVRPDGFVFNSTMYISAEKDAQLRKGKLQRNDVVMTTRGTIGNIGLYSDDVPFDNIRINSGMLIFRPNQKEILPAYLFEMLRSGIVKEQIRKYTTGAAQPQLPIKTLVNFSIPVPTDLAVQAEIVEKIREFEPQIQRLEALYQRKIAALDELKKSLLQQAFSGEL